VLRQFHRFHHDAILYGAGLLVAAVLVTFLGVTPAVAAPAASAFTEFERVSSRRVGRTLIEFTYRAKAQNRAPAIEGVTASVTSSASSTVIVDSDLNFPDLGVGEEAFSSDTFSFRQNRRIPFDSSALSFSFSFTAANTPPVADAGLDQTIFTGETVTLNGSGSSDADGDGLTYLWSLTGVPVGSSAGLSDTSSISPSFNADVPGTYEVQLIVNDGAADSALDIVVISTVNAAPVADAGADQAVLIGETATLDGSGSSDADGDALSFSWLLVTVPDGSAAVLSDASAVMPSFVVDLPGTYEAQLVVNDGMDGSLPDAVIISTENVAPVANAGADQTADLGARVSLDGAGSSDVDGDGLTFAWSLTSAPQGSAAVLSSISAIMPTFTADVPGTYVAQLIVNDGTVDSAPDTVTVMTGNTAPLADAGPDQTLVLGATAMLNGSGSSDADGDDLTFRWSLIAKPDGSGAVLSDFTSDSPSFVLDAPGEYVAQLIVNDGAIDSAPDQVMIATENVRPVAEAGDNQSVVVGSTISLDGSVSSDADGDPLSFAWSLLSMPLGSSAIISDPAIDNPTFVADVVGTYLAQLIVNDGTLDSVPDTVMIEAGAANTAPVADAGPDQSVELGQIATLDGSNSSDADSDPLAFRWTISSAPAGSVATLSNASSASAGLTPDIAGTYVITLVVNDGMVDSVMDTVTVIALTPSGGNNPPVLDPIGNRTIALGQTLSFALTASDQDGDRVSFMARPLPLPGNATLDGVSGAFRFKPAAGQTGTFSITFLAEDGLSTDEEVVVITVTAPDPNALTSVSGRLLDANAAANGETVPVLGATVSILGTGISTMTDAQGLFTLEGFPMDVTPVLDIVASPTFTAPDGSLYANFREPFDLIENAANDIVRPIFLPRIDPAGIANVVSGMPTMVENPNIGVMLEIPAFTVKNTDGSDYTGPISVSAVPPSQAPVALPEGIDPALLITIQPAGLIFSNPVPVTFPNLDNMPAGSEMEIFSVNPDSGLFERVGMARVSTDGATIQTITGGISRASWQIVVPPPPTEPPGGPLEDNNETNKSKDPCTCKEVETGSRTALASGNLRETHVTAGYRSFGVTQTQRFVYNTTLADPRPIVKGSTGVGDNAAIPNMVSTRLSVGGVDSGVEQFYDTSTYDPADGFIRTARQFDASALPTGRYATDYTITSKFSESARSTTDTQQTLVRNEQQSPFGAGWTLAGLDQIIEQGDGSLILAQGDGSTLVFERNEELRTPVVTFDFENQPRTGSIPSLSLNQNGLVVGLAASVDGGMQILDLGVADTQFVQDRTIRLFDFVFQNDDPAIITLSEPVSAFSFGAGAIRSTTGPDIEVIVRAFDQSGSLVAEVTGLIPPNPNSVFSEIQVEISATTPFSTITIDQPDLLNLIIDNFSFERIETALPESIATTYDAPAGDFSRVIGRVDGSFVRTMKTGVRQIFDVEGRLIERVEPNNKSRRFRYDGAGRISEIEDAAGLLTRFSYTGSGLLQRITEPSGRVTEFEHDDAGNVTRIIDPDFSSRRFAYDLQHKLISQTSKRNFETTYDYDAFGRNMQANRTDGSVRQVRAGDTTGLISVSSGLGTQANPVPLTLVADESASFVDGNGNSTIFSVDSFGASTSRTDALGRTATTQRDDNGDPTLITDFAGTQSTFTYDARGNLLASIRGSNIVGRQIRRFIYDPRFAKPMRFIDSVGARTEFVYTLMGDLAEITDQLRTRTTFEYGDANCIGAVTQLTRAAGDAEEAAQQFEYDPATCNLSRSINGVGDVTAFQYDSSGNISAITEGAGAPEARTTAFTYDPMNRLLTATDGEGGVTTFQYDAAGNLVQTQSPTGEMQARTYDVLERIASVNDPISGLATLDYDLQGNLIRTSDAEGGVTQFFYDSLNRTERSLDAESGERLFAYDSNSNLTSITDARGETTAFGYDGFNRVISRVDAGGRERRFTYDVRNNLSGETIIDPDTDRSVRTFFFNYDFLSRLQGRTVLSTVDGFIASDQYTYDRLSRLKTARNNNSQVLSFEYDGADRIVRAATDNRVTPATVLNFAYNSAGDRISVADDQGGEALYLFDRAGRMTQVMTPSAQAITFGYDLAGRFDAITFPNAVISDFAYGVDGRLERLVHIAGGTALDDLNYQYDNVGNITAIGELTRTRGFTYDLLQQVIAGGTPTEPETYLYDGEGNRVASHLSNTHIADETNRLLEDDDFTYAYDIVGNLISRTKIASGDVTLYVYDGFNRLSEVTRADGVVVAYFYDALDRRVRKDITATDASVATTAYIYDGEDIIMEFTGVDVGVNELTLTSRYTHGPDRDQPLAVERGGVTFFYHADRLGSIRKLTDAAGVTVNAYEYDSFGKRLAATEAVPQPYSFTGREFDPESGLYYYRARTYDPNAGRFMQEDPLGFGAGDMNLYRYVENNGVNLIDPAGTANFRRAGAGVVSAAGNLTSGLFKTAGAVALKSVTAGTAGIRFVTAKSPKQKAKLLFDTVTSSPAGKEFLGILREALPEDAKLLIDLSNLGNSTSKDIKSVSKSPGKFLLGKILNKIDNTGSDVARSAGRDLGRSILDGIDVFRALTSDMRDAPVPQRKPSFNSAIPVPTRKPFNCIP
jgi:RHS repeat-associated protein